MDSPWRTLAFNEAVIWTLYHFKSLNGNVKRWRERKKLGRCNFHFCEPLCDWKPNILFSSLERERERKFYFIARASTTLGRSSLAVESTSESRKRFCRSCGTCRQRRRLEGNSPIMSQPQFCEKHSNFAKRHKRELRKEKKINCQCFCLPQPDWVRKWANPGLYFVLILPFSKKYCNFYNQVMWKIFIEYLEPGYKLTTSCFWVSSFNH